MRPDRPRARARRPGGRRGDDAGGAGARRPRGGSGRVARRVSACGLRRRL